MASQAAHTTHGSIFKLFLHNKKKEMKRIGEEVRAKNRGTDLVTLPAKK